MNRGRIIVLAMAVVSAGLAMMLMKNMVKGPQTKIVKQEVSEIQVLVAKRDISLGARLKPSDLKWQAWPGSAAKGYITRQRNPKAIRKYTGSVARFAIGAGDPIRANKLVRAENGGVMAAILPTGFRAISIEISNAAGVSGLILPNDRVDLILTTKTGKARKSASETLLHNVRVLAIGTVFATKNSQKSMKGKTATLALSPTQVEIVTQARSRGKLWLSLRSLADASEKKGEVKKQRVTSSSVKILKFGVASEAFGVE